MCVGRLSVNFEIVCRNLFLKHLRKVVFCVKVTTWNLTPRQFFFSIRNSFNYSTRLFIYFFRFFIFISTRACFFKELFPKFTTPLHCNRDRMFMSLLFGSFWQDVLTFSQAGKPQNKFSYQYFSFVKSVHTKFEQEIISFSRHSFGTVQKVNFSKGLLQ